MILRQANVSQRCLQKDVTKQDVLCRAVSCRIGGRPVNTTWAEPKKTEDTSQVGCSAAYPQVS